MHIIHMSLDQHDVVIFQARIDLHMTDYTDKHAFLLGLYDI